MFRFYLTIISLLSFQPLCFSEHATFAGGCFWCMEPIYQSIDGVESTTVGFMGGTVKNPSYQEVTSGNTGHTEVIDIEYDPTKVTYEKLLELFWKNIDPTVEDRQFCDIGNQYRTAIFYHNEDQKLLAEKTKQALLEEYDFDAIYTEISPAGPFYPAEEYHQDYAKKNPIRYKFYRYLCGRDQRLEELWKEN